MRAALVAAAGLLFGALFAWSVRRWKDTAAAAARWDAHDSRRTRSHMHAVSRVGF